MNILNKDFDLTIVDLRKVVVGASASLLVILGLSLVGSDGGDALSVHAQEGNATPTRQYFLEPGKVYSYCGSTTMPGSVPPGKYCMFGVYVVPGTEGQYWSDGVPRPTLTPRPGETLPSHVRITATPVVE